MSRSGHPKRHALNSADVLAGGLTGVHFAWIWDHRPLDRNAWPNREYPAGRVKSGQTIAVRDLERVKRDGDGTIEYKHLKLPIVARATDDRIVERIFYRPTDADLALLRRAFPMAAPENPDWLAIEAELVAAGAHTRADLAAMGAPALLRLLDGRTTDAERAAADHYDPKIGILASRIKTLIEHYHRGRIDFEQAQVQLGGILQAAIDAGGLPHHGDAAANRCFEATFRNSPYDAWRVMADGWETNDACIYPLLPTDPEERFVAFAELVAAELRNRANVDPAWTAPRKVKPATDTAAPQPDAVGETAPDSAASPNVDGYVERPADPTAYVPMATILAEYAGELRGELSERRLRTIIEDYTTNRIRWTRPLTKAGKPAQNRRHVHLNDWLDSLRRTCGTADGDSLPDPAHVERTMAAMRQRKAAGR